MPGNTYFTPQIFIKNCVKDIQFYMDGLGATELRRFSNDDETVHVSELTINGAMFHIHEENPSKGHYEPSKYDGVTALVGLFVEDVDALINRAVGAGATLINPPQDYEYGYRQGEIKDPFGHIWLIQKKI